MAVSNNNMDDRRFLLCDSRNVENKCCECRFDFWDDLAKDYDGSSGIYVCLASGTECNDGFMMYSASRNVKMAEGKKCWRHKKKRFYWWNPKPILPYKVSVIGGEAVKIGRG